MKADHDTRDNNIYSDSENSYRNLRFFLEFIQREFQKGVPVKSTSSFRRALKKLEGHMGPAEFPGNTGTEKQELIIRFLAAGETRNFMELEKDEDIIKTSFRSFFAGEFQFPFFNLFLPHLHIKKTRLFEDRLPEFLNTLHHLCSTIKQGSWIVIHDLLKEGGRNTPVLFADTYAADYIYYTKTSTYKNLLGDSGVYEENVYLDTGEKQHNAAVLPAARGVFSLMGAFGLVDLRMRVEDLTNVFSPYDHIEALRLTPLGAYVFGQASTFSPAKKQRFIALSKTGLIATATDPGGLSFLQKMGEQVAERSVRTNLKILFTQIDSRDEILNLTRYLLDHAQLPVPENWTQFINSVRSRCMALGEKKQETVYMLPDNPELISFLGSSPEAASLMFKAEGKRIILPARNRKPFKKLLRENGFFIE